MIRLSHVNLDILTTEQDFFQPALLG